jgi:hypothetical protein
MDFTFLPASATSSVCIFSNQSVVGSSLIGGGGGGPLFQLQPVQQYTKRNMNRHTRTQKETCTDTLKHKKWRMNIEKHHSRTHTHKRAHPQAHTHTPSSTLTHTHTQTHTHTHTQVHTPTHTDTRTHTHAHAHPLSFSEARTHILTHTVQPCVPKIGMVLPKHMHLRNSDYLRREKRKKMRQTGSSTLTNQFFTKLSYPLFVALSYHSFFFEIQIYLHTLHTHTNTNTHTRTHAHMHTHAYTHTYMNTSTYKTPNCADLFIAAIAFLCHDGKQTEKDVAHHSREAVEHCKGIIN